MAKKEVLKRVPNKDVDARVQDFKDDGATDVEVHDNGDDTSDITATFP